MTKSKPADGNEFMFYLILVFFDRVWRQIRWQSVFFFIIILNVARDGCIEQLWRMDSFPGVRFVLKLLKITFLSTGK